MFCARCWKWRASNAFCRVLFRSLADLTTFIGGAQDLSRRKSFVQGESGYHRTYISFLERGKKSPSLSTIMDLAEDAPRAGLGDDSQSGNAAEVKAGTPARFK